MHVQDVRFNQPSKLLDACRACQARKEVWLRDYVITHASSERKNMGHAKASLRQRRSRPHVIKTVSKY